MRLFRWSLVLAPAILLAAAQVQSAESKNKGRVTLPAEAVKVDAYTHRYTDADGKKWIYRQTPFGLVRYEDTAQGQSAGSKQPDPTSPAKPAPSPSSPESKSEPETTGIKAVEEGDTVRFEKQGPFGKYTWVRKKDELNEQEKAALEESRRASAGKKSK